MKQINGGKTYKWTEYSISHIIFGFLLEHLKHVQNFILENSRSQERFQAVHSSPTIKFKYVKLVKAPKKKVSNYTCFFIALEILILR